MNIDFYIDGERSDAAVLNRPIRQLNDGKLDADAQAVDSEKLGGIFRTDFVEKDNLATGTGNSTETAMDQKSTTAALNNKLDLSGKAADSELLDGKDSSLFLQKNEIDAAISSLFAGQVAMFPSTKVPNGWIKADGATVSRTEFSFLWMFALNSNNLAETESAKLDGEFGPGNGVSTFTLPDLRGQHLRGLDDGKGIDIGRVIGTYQEDAIKQHKHDATSSTNGYHNHSASSAAAGSHSHSASSAAAGTHNHTGSIGGGEHSHSYLYHAYERPGTEKNRDSSDTSGVYKTGTTGGSGTHSHTLTIDSSGDHSHTITVANAGSHSHTISVDSTGDHSHTITVSNTGISENRVKNIALMTCIKY